MATEQQPKPLWQRDEFFDPDGPVCLIVQATMSIAAGLDRFQPAGFPEVGHVIYQSPDPEKDKVCIVDSAASMANHLEQVCLAAENDPALHLDLTGLPYVKCVTDRNGEGGTTTGGQDQDQKHELVTTSLLIGHRIGSEYFIHPNDKPTLLTGVNQGEVFREVLRREFAIREVKPNTTYFVPPEAWWSIYATLFKYDPNSLIHGVLFAREQIKISRLLTAHLEAYGASRVGSSGVMLNTPRAPEFDQPIFAKDEETAREIRATFIIDLGILRSYGREKATEAKKQGQGTTEEPKSDTKQTDCLGLNRQQKELLLALAVWKVRQLLRRTFSYRSGCKLAMKKVEISTDVADLKEPLPERLEEVDIKNAIELAYSAKTAAKEHTTDNADSPDNPPDGAASSKSDTRVTSVYYPFDELFKPGKEEKKGEADQGDDADDDDESEEA